MASVKDVAERAGVSVGTVSNVLNRPEKVAPYTVLRVRAAIKELGFVRNDVARQLRAGSSKSVGLIVLDVGNPFFTDVARGAEERAAEDGYTVLLGNSDENIQREARYLEQFEQQRVHGVLVSPAGEDLAFLADLKARGMPVVLVDREAGTAGFSSVAVDDIAGGSIAAKHLIDNQRRQLAFVGGPRSIRQVQDRLKGCQREVRLATGVSLEVIVTGALTVAQGRSVGEDIARRSITARPDGIIAANDLLAIGLLQGLLAAERPVAVPRELAIIGYDDIEFAAAAVVPLSSVRQPSEEMGRTAMDMLLGEAAAEHSQVAFAPKRVVFHPELVVRASTAPPVSEVQSPMNQTVT